MEGAIKRPVGSPNILPVFLIQCTNNEFIFVFKQVGIVSFVALLGEISGLKLILGSCVDWTPCHSCVR